MKTVAVLGSPREGGNCDILVNYLLEKLPEEKTFYNINELDVGYCQADQACQNGPCILYDDGNKIVDDMLEADLFIFSTPIYYGQMSAQAKTLIDRFYQVSQNPTKSLAGTNVIQIYTQASPSNAYDSYAEGNAHMPFGYMGMKVIGTVIAKGAGEKGDMPHLKDAMQQIDNIIEDL